MAQDEEWKTTFHICAELYKYLVIPFGLVNVPSTFQNYINDIVTIKEGAAGYLYSQHPPNLETRLTGQGDHMQGSRDLHGTGSHD